MPQRRKQSEAGRRNAKTKRARQSAERKERRQELAHSREEVSFIWVLATSQRGGMPCEHCVDPERQQTRRRFKMARKDFDTEVGIRAAHGHCPVNACGAILASHRQYLHHRYCPAEGEDGTALAWCAAAMCSV